MISEKSMIVTPANTPVRLSISMPRDRPPACKAKYPCSRSDRCCGSMAAASAGDMPKKRLSKHSTDAIKPPERIREATSDSKPCSDESQRAAGTWATVALLVDATRHACCVQEIDCMGNIDVSCVLLTCLSKSLDAMDFWKWKM